MYKQRYYKSYIGERGREEVGGKYIESFYGLKIIEKRNRGKESSA
jgi:hypothetical protein